jgi:signal transduction histidine kinase
MHAVKAIKSGNVGVAGATGAVLDRSLLGMRNLIDSSLAEVRVIAGLPASRPDHSTGRFLGEVEAAAALDPRAGGIKLTVTPVDLDIVVYADPEMLASAVGNLLQNAFKFTKRHTEVTLHAYSERDRVMIEVKDHCGGLPPGPAESLLRPFAQRGSDRSGLGLGLEICRRSVEANHGTLAVRDLTGIGCVFTITLPRHRESAPAQSASAP